MILTIDLDIKVQGGNEGVIERTTTRLQKPVYAANRRGDHIAWDTLKKDGWSTSIQRSSTLMR